MSTHDFRPHALTLLLGACILVPSLAGAQVTYFERPPTAEQLRAALRAGTNATTPPAETARPLPSGTRTRGIVWQATGAGAAVPTAAATAATAASTTAAADPPPLPGTVGDAQPGSARASLYAPAPATASPAAALPINFDVGSSHVDRNSLPYIETIASVMRTDPSIQLVIEGHTDDRGSYNRNMVLSWDRALGVFRTLVETYGIDPKRLQPVGKGPLEPMPGTDPSDGANRRVQFRISG